MTTMLARPLPQPTPEWHPPVPPVARTRRLPRKAGTAWRNVVGCVTWASILFVVALWVAAGNLAEFSSLAGALDAVGRLTGLIASDLLLLQVAMMARIPVVEQSFGQDELVRRHRLIGFWSFNLMLVHILLIWLGYSTGSSLGLWGTIVDLVLNYPGMLLALAGTGALCMVVVTSVRRARRRLRYESWHLIHLYGYLGAGLALPHQLWTGQDFVFSPVATVFWWGLWFATLVAVLVFRIDVPLWRNAFHQLRVVGVRPAGPSASTVTVTGRHLSRLPVRAGQFFQWRFLGGPFGSRAHPYSLSAAPDGQRLEVTIAHLGDDSARTPWLVPGSRVVIEGPYGRLHSGVRTQRKMLLMAGGIGITPLKALLEEAVPAPGQITLIYRASAGDVLWRNELQALAATKGARLFFVEGPRRANDSWLPVTAGHLGDAAALHQLVPDVVEQDVFLCGGVAWMSAVRRALDHCGVPESNVHFEQFTY